MPIATGDAVTFEYTGRLEDGTVFDTSREVVAEEAGLTDAELDREYTPLTIDVGTHQVIEGMENGLIGLEEGEAATIEIPPEEAYGKWDEADVQEFDTAELEEMIGGQTPEEGGYLEAENGRQGEIVHVDDETTRVDFNHELAGKPLAFDVEILDVN
ncbi:FKBP-type peptidyl-prolyl cis-trans isomerase [Halobacterium noricense]|uniref:FKBP-type peptidyl-prolyl cis-trans isomerase n=1 Tax=Halobacterium noricense TaxID=223182 RepID=UPI001E5E3750|nr:FKBP-type peptidyl-prolyl cis-trans isomerase [Halobacterium noricense]UHH23924.1 FKBP-type peptidyl-prolyl cis-trans isomerase [Halobacterium noricense]